MYENITSIDQLINKNKYPLIEKEINDYLKRIIERNIGNIHTIISIDRKGSWILHEFFHENPELSKFNLLTDNRLKSNKIKGLNILLFDDSLRSGRTILSRINEIMKFSPNSIQLFCLLINNEAINNIKEFFPDIKIDWHKFFSTYEKQQEEYMKWEITYLSGLRIKDNPDYPILKLVTSYKDLNSIYDNFVLSLKKVVKIFDRFTIESIASTKNSLDISIDIKTNDTTPLKPYKSIISEIDGYKIRCYMAVYGDITEIRIVPLLNPRYDPTKCNIWKKYPENCLYKLYKLDRSELTCKMCVPISVNLNFITIIQAEVIPEMRKRGLIIDDVDLRTPEFRRFTRI